MDLGEGIIDDEDESRLRICFSLSGVLACNDLLLPGFEVALGLPGVKGSLDLVVVCKIFDDQPQHLHTKSNVGVHDHMPTLCLWL